MNIKIVNRLFWVLGAFCLLAVGFLPLNTKAEIGQVDVYVFYKEACPHCATEREYLHNLRSELDYIEIHEYEITERNASQALDDIADELGVRVMGVPFLVIGNWSYEGYNDDFTTGIQIKEQIEYFHENPDEYTGNTLQHLNQEGSGVEVSFPFLGNLDVGSLSLPVATVAIGFLDGFNPCAMWVLLFLISMLIGMKDRRRAWVLGMIFIVVSTGVYFFFMAAWLNFLLFIGMVSVIQILIGLAAIGGGAWNLSQFRKNKDGGCRVVSEKKRDKLIDRIKKITRSSSFWVAVLGIIALAFSVNLVELLCSAGLPAVYAQLLAMHNLSGSAYYGYLLLYVLVFMLDDIIIFAIAMSTLKLTGISTKYQRWTSLIGGILMIIIGFLLIFMPEVLVFGG